MSYALSDVSTYLPYADATAITREGVTSVFQLELSDLSSDCPLATPMPTANHNTNKDGCNPVLEYRVDLKDAAAKFVVLSR